MNEAITILMRSTANNDVREYHVRQRENTEENQAISDLPYLPVLDTEMVGGQDSFPNFDAIGRRGSMFLKELQGSPDIEKLTFRTYSVKVQKRQSSTWLDVQSEIKRALVKVYGEVNFIDYNFFAFANLSAKAETPTESPVHV